MAIKTNDGIQTKGIEIIPESSPYTGRTTWMFRFTRIDGSRQSCNDFPGPFEALAEALHTLRREGADPAWQKYLKQKSVGEKQEGDRW